MYIMKNPVVVPSRRSHRFSDMINYYKDQSGAIITTIGRSALTFPKPETARPKERFIQKIMRLFYTKQNHFNYNPGTLVGTEIQNRHLAMEQDQKFRMFIEEEIYAILVADESGGNFLANHLACELFGYSKEEFRTLNLSDLMFEEDVRNTAARVGDFANGKEVNYKNRFRSKDGKEVFIDVYAKVLSNGLKVFFIKEVLPERK
jgi:PAS domain S-box-containing protein